MKKHPTGIKSHFIAVLMLLCVVPASSVFSQPFGRHYTKYSVNDGLPEGFVYTTSRDQQGFLWIATTNGISRFDGYSFRNFTNDVNDSNSLPDHYVLDLYIDTQNRVWALSYNWLYLYRPEAERFEVLANIPADNFNEFCGDEDGNLIIGSHKTIYKFNKSSGKLSLLHPTGLSDRIYYDYAKDEHGFEWFGSSDGLVKFDPKTNLETLLARNISNDAIKTVTALYLLPGNSLLGVPQRDKVFIMNRNTGFITTYDLTSKQKQGSSQSTDNTANVVFGVYRFNDSIFAFSVNDSIFFFNSASKAITVWEPEQTTLTSNEHDHRVLSIYQDHEGITWLAGRFFLKKVDFLDHKITVYSKNDSKARNRFSNFYNLLQCDENHYLLSSKYYGFSIYNREKNEIFTVNNVGLNKENINKIERVGPNSFVGNFSTYLFFFKCKKGEIADVQIKNIKGYSPLPFTITSFTQLTNNRILLGGTFGLMIVDSSGNTVKLFDSINYDRVSPNTNTIVSICKSKNGGYWVGSSRGVFKLEKDEATIKKYPYRINGKVVKYGYSKYLVEDKRSIVWFITNQNGIGRIDPKNDSLSFIGTKEGLPTTTFSKLCIDDNDNLWAKSRMGIVCINTMTLQSELYTEQEGFPNPDDIIDIYFDTSINKLQVLTNNSIYQIETKKLVTTTSSPATRIIELSVFDSKRPINSNKTVHLNYKENFITIKFSCLLFHNNRQIRYAYKMVGVDKDWVNCNNKREAAYTNLSPGKYTFLVKSRSPNGIWSKEPAILHIVVQPPFWRKWWFYAIIALTVLVIIVWIARSYTARKLASQRVEFEKLKAVSDERVRIASDLHDDIGSGLTSIRLLGEVAHLKVGYNNPARFEIEKILSAVGKMSEGLREILWTMNAKFDRLEDFIIYTRSYSVEYFDNSTINFQFSRPDIIPELTIPGQSRRNIFLSVKEALHNIVKHSGATEASLNFNITNDTIVITIKDNGKGIDSTLPNIFGNGLNSMKERLNKLGGKLELDVKNGTCLTFTIDIFHRLA